MPSFTFNFLYDFSFNSILNIITSPIDTIKLLLQNENALLNLGILSSPYNGIIDCYKRTIHSNGILYLWSGNFMFNLEFLPKKIIKYAILGYLQQEIGEIDRKTDEYFTWLFSKVFPISCANIISSLCVYPLRYIKLRLCTNLNNSNKGKQFTGNLDVFVQTIASEGILGLYRGFFIQIIESSIYHGLFFIIQDIFQQITPEKYRKDPCITIIISSTTLIIANSLVYPIYTIRTRMMMSNCSNMVFTSGYSCLKYIITNEGYLSLYKGIYLNTYRLFGVVMLLHTYSIFKNITYSLISSKSNTIDNN